MNTDLDNLHHVLRDIRETKSTRRDHLTVFREFLDHLDRIGRRRAPAAKTKSAKPKRRRAG